MERILDEFLNGDKARPKEAAPMKKSKKSLKKGKKLAATRTLKGPGAAYDPVDG